MYESFAPLKNQLLPNFSISPFKIFAEMNHEEFLCILRKLNKTNCAYDLFDVRNMSSELVSYQIRAICTDTVNSSFSFGVFPDSEKYPVVKSLLKTGKDRDAHSPY